MPLMRGWHYVNSRVKSLGVRDPSGQVHTRTQAENTGARWMGYKNEHDYRARRREADRYIKSVMESRQGKRDIERAKANAKSARARFSEREYRKTIIALRNAERDRKGDPVNRGPDSPIAVFHDQMGSQHSDAWDVFVRGTDTP